MAIHPKIEQHDVNMELAAAVRKEQRANEQGAKGEMSIEMTPEGIMRTWTGATGDKSTHLMGKTQQEHRKNGKLHNVGGPAILRYDGTAEWWHQGNLVACVNLAERSFDRPMDMRSLLGPLDTMDLGKILSSRGSAMLTAIHNDAELQAAGPSGIALPL